VELPREQAGNTGPVERHLPTGEFLLREEIALTRYFASDDPGPHGHKNGGLATRRPPLGLRRRQNEILLVSRCSLAADAGAITISGFRFRSPDRLALNQN
jgi:hypothetical protein